MNNITFLTLKAKNVLSIGEEIQIDYRTAKGLTYVYGENKDIIGAKNGCGKTAVILSCLLIALFGKTINNTNNAYLYNRQASWKDGGYIELELIKNSTDKYRIFVELKPNKRKDKCSLNFYLFKNDEDITNASKYDTLDYIENIILGCKFDIFKNAIVMSSSNLMNFFEMPKRIKNEYLQGVFSLNSLGLAYTYSNNKLNDIKKNLKIISNDLFKVSNELEEFTQLNEQWESKHNSNISDLENKINQTNSKLNAKGSTIEKPNNYDKKLELIQRYEELEQLKNKINPKLNSIKKEIIELKSEIKVNKILIEKNSDMINCLCDDCKPKISKLFKLDKAKEIIETSTNRIETLLEQEANLENNLNKILKFQNKANDAKIEINDYENSKLLEEQSIKHLKTTIKNLTEQLNELQNSINPYTPLIENAKNSKINLNNSLNKLTSVNQYYGLLKEIFSENGVKQSIIQKIIEVLNASIHSYLRQMGADFLVYFDNKLVYNFYTPSGPCEYSSFSAGERRKLDLAILFAFRDVLGCSSLKTNICIIDEILDSAIDSVTLNSVMSILKNKSKMDNQSIYVISHREGLAESDIFDHKIRIEKENGNSKYFQEF